MVLENMIDNEWDYVNIENESQPSYADIVMNNMVFVQDPLKKVMTEQTHTCSNIKQSLATVDQEYSNNAEDNHISLEDMWFNSKYEGAKSYHRKIEKSKGRTKVIGDHALLENLEKGDFRNQYLFMDLSNLFKNKAYRVKIIVSKRGFWELIRSEIMRRIIYPIRRQNFQICHHMP